MRKFTAALLAVSLVPFLFQNAVRAGSLEAKGGEIVAQILTNPAAFFYEFQQDLEWTTPLPPGSWGGVQLGIFPVLLPMGYANLSGKLRLHPEGRWFPGMPQVDVYGGYWKMLLADMAVKQSDDITSADFHGQYVGLTLTTSVSPKVRLFGGWKYARVRANLQLSKQQDIFGTKVDSFSSGLEDHFLVAGIEYPTGLNKWWTMQFNYGLTQELISAKLGWSGQYFDLGLNVYPEGVLVIHPTWNFHVYF
ncbi:MAG: hypothetical protein WCS77_00435 [Elusimicrobiaceae bacterium]